MKRYTIQSGAMLAEESDDGFWVRYEDHAAEVAALVAQLEAARELLARVEEDRVQLSVQQLRERAERGGPAAKARLASAIEDARADFGVAAFLAARESEGEK